MDLCFAPLFSGSSGNCVYVGSENGGLLVDAGVSGKRILTALKSIAVPPGAIHGLLVTHDHNDHIQSVGILSRKLDIPVYATAGTWEGMIDKIGPVAMRNQRIIEADREFGIGDLGIMPFPIPHDTAEPVGFAFDRFSARFAVATDIGCMRSGWMDAVLGCDAVLLEANYDPDMLVAGPYPYHLKQRILSTKGHLSNDDSAKAAVRLANAGTKQIILGHLSKENNFPELAMRTVASVMQIEGIDIESDVSLRVAKRDDVTGMFEVRTDWL